MSNVLNNTYANYHSHALYTYLLMEAILFRSDARPSFWMKTTASGLHQFSLSGVLMFADVIFKYHV